MFNLDPKKMQEMMKKMGMSQESIEASEVVIKTPEKNIIIENPSVVKIKIQGQESFQITGDVVEQLGISEEDIQTVMDKTGASRKEAKESLERTNDLAESILELG
ncbi:nascent polypeptide-associated complex protein [Candidatus Pacearchaeota archaeon]|nr:nascent polypeptide-associated complex protein [Candidatus Pacearchaeota archaeon]